MPNEQHPGQPDRDLPEYDHPCDTEPEMTPGAARRGQLTRRFLLAIEKESIEAMVDRLLPPLSIDDLERLRYHIDKARRQKPDDVRSFVTNVNHLLDAFRLRILADGEDVARMTVTKLGTMRLLLFREKKPSRGFANAKTINLVQLPADPFARSWEPTGLLQDMPFGSAAVSNYALESIAELVPKLLPPLSADDHEKLRFHLLIARDCKPSDPRMWVRCVNRILHAHMLRVKADGKDICKNLHYDSNCIRLTLPGRRGGYRSFKKAVTIDLESLPVGDQGHQKPALTPLKQVG